MKLTVSAATRLLACASVAGLLNAAPVHVSAAPEAAGKPMTFDALRGVVGVSEPAISPDGSRVAYIRERGDYKANEYSTEIELVEVANGNVRALTHGRHGVSDLRWSPHGDRLAFLASPEPGKPGQIYVLPMNGGDALQVTTAKDGVTDFAWRPDGSGFAFAGPDRPKPLKPAGYVAAFTVTDEHFLTRQPSDPVALWTVRDDGSASKRLTSGKASVNGFAPLAFTPDGKYVVATMQPDAITAHLTKTQTVRVDATTGAVTPLIANGIDGGGPLSHDGTKIALAIPRHGSLYLERDASIRSFADGKELASGSGIDRNVHGSAWSSDDRVLYTITHDGVRTVLWKLTMDGKSSRVDLGDVDVSGPVTVAGDGTIALVGVTRTDPGNIYVLHDGSQPKKLTDENAWLSGYAAPRRDRVTWQSDGRTVDGVLTYPIGYHAGMTYPLVLNIHGGPVSASTWDLDRYDMPLDEILAAHGYLVLEPNYRGSDSAGDAFLQAIVGDVTSGPGRDNLRGVEAIEAMGIVDRSRIAVGGWSGGGLQTSWLVGHSTIWRAAVSGAGVDDWFEQAVLSDINEEFASNFMGGATPWTKAGRQLYADESPSTYAARITTPLLILSDVGDQRVPITQSFALYRALHDRGKQVEFMAWPRSGHFPSDPVGRESIFKAWSGWFERWLR